MEISNIFVRWCLRNKYIKETQIPWLKYIVEKILSTVIGIIVMFVVGGLITSWIRTASFLVSFAIIRCRTNGFHANTKLGCFIFSVGMELLFLKVIPSNISFRQLLVIFLVSVTAIWKLAPFDHPKMHLSDSEKNACAKSAKIRILLLLLLAYVLHIFSDKQAVLGIILGINMASFSLILAYLLNLGGKENVHKNKN